MLVLIVASLRVSVRADANDVNRGITPARTLVIPLVRGARSPGERRRGAGLHTASPWSARRLHPPLRVWVFAGSRGILMSSSSGVQRGARRWGRGTGLTDRRGERGGPRWGRGTGLTDRRAERGALGRIVEAVRAGQSRALVVRGDPGVGKTALLDHLTGRAADSGCRVARAAGVQSEMELAYAGLHQLCAPMLDHLGQIPAPQHDALRTAFGIAGGPAPDRFLIGLGVLSLLSEVAGERPLICVIDDEQWLDRASVQALGFAARRLGADPVAVVFAARDPGADLAGLPELVVTGLGDSDARALLGEALPGPLDERVRDLIIAETRGNPLALLELPRGLTPAELAGG